MADTIRQRIIENRRAAIEAIGELAGCEYDKPLDATRTEIPFGWVYDLEEQYDLDAGVGVSVNVLSLGIIVAYRYSRDEGLGLVGNRLLGLVWAALMEDETCGGLAYNCTPVWSGFQDYPGAAWTGELRMRVDIQFYTNKRDMTAQTVATP